MDHATLHLHSTPGDLFRVVSADVSCFDAGDIIQLIGIDEDDDAVFRGPDPTGGIWTTYWMSHEDIEPVTLEEVVREVLTADDLPIRSEEWDERAIVDEAGVSVRLFGTETQRQALDLLRPVVHAIEHVAEPIGTDWVHVRAARS